jgi:hypothetical protein
MIERPDPVDEPDMPEDPAPVRDPDPAPRAPQQSNPDARPKVPPGKPKVTPLDEEQHIKEGIEVKET